MLLFAAIALFAFGCASRPPPAPVVVERIYYLPAPVSPPEPCPPAAHHPKPKRHRHRPPRAVIGTRDSAHHGHAARPPKSRGRGPRTDRPPHPHGHDPHATLPPRKRPTRIELPDAVERPEKPRRPLRADIPRECQGACRERVKRRERECRRAFDRSHVEACVEQLEREMRRAGAPDKPRG